MFRSTTSRNESKALRSLLALAMALCLCAAPAALAGCSSGGQQGAQASSQGASAAEGLSVALTVSDGDQPVLDEAIEGLADGATVLDALMAAPVDVMVEDSSYGLYVTSIAGIAADATHGWTYTVNGEQPVEGADKVTVAEGDSIAWSYIEFSPEAA